MRHLIFVMKQSLSALDQWYAFCQYSNLYVALVLSPINLSQFICPCTIMIPLKLAATAKIII